MFKFPLLKGENAMFKQEYISDVIDLEEIIGLNKSIPTCLSQLVKNTMIINLSICYNMRACIPASSKGETHFQWSSCLILLLSMVSICSGVFSTYSLAFSYILSFRFSRFLRYVIMLSSFISMLVFCRNLSGF